MSLKEHKPKLLLTFSMFVFGTVGVARRYLPLPSGFVSMSRAVIGSIFLIIVMLLSKIKIDRAAVKKNLWRLVISGICMGGNWILLFESYNHTTVATATLCYYMAPIILIIMSPIIFKEKITPRNAVCIAFAIVGVLMISGIFESRFSAGNNFIGIMLGLGAAILYASVMMISKSVNGINSHLKTVIQMSSSLIAVVPYILIAETVSSESFTPGVIILLFVVGILHTGFTYTLYFGNMEKVSAQTLAVMSYIDPVVAVILSAVVLKESITVFGIVGAVFIIGAAAALE